MHRAAKSKCYYFEILEIVAIQKMVDELKRAHLHNKMQDLATKTTRQGHLPTGASWVVRAAVAEKMGAAGVAWGNAVGVGMPTIPRLTVMAFARVPAIPKYLGREGRNRRIERKDKHSLASRCQRQGQAEEEIQQHVKCSWT